MYTGDRDLLDLDRLGFSLNPKKVAERHIRMLRSAATRHLSIVKKIGAIHKKMALRHVGLVRRPFQDIRSMRTGASHPSAAAGSAVAAPGVQYTDEYGNPIPASELYNYTDEAGNPLGPAPAGSTSLVPYTAAPPVDASYIDPDTGYYPASGDGYSVAEDGAPQEDYASESEGDYGAPVPIDPRLLLTLPASRISELARSGALYPGSGATARALYARERALYQSPVFQPPISVDDISQNDWEPAPDRTVYGVEHTPMTHAAMVPPYYGPQSPYAPWMSETEETAWSDRNAVYPAAAVASADDWAANVGPSFEDDAYGADSLSGLYDVLIGDPIAFWKEKWNDAKAKLSKALVDISGTGQTLAAIRTNMDQVTDAASSSTSLSPDDLAQIDRTRQTLSSLESNQATLEGRAADATAQIAKTASDNPDSGLGIFPIVAVGVIVATVVAIVGAVIVHTQNVNALAREMQAIMDKKITAGDIQQIQGGSGLPGFSLPDVGGAAKGLALLAVVGVGAYLFLKARK